MKFSISRVSDYGEEKKPPCPEAHWDEQDWFVEFDTIEQLVQFVDREGPIIIQKYYKEQEFHITIYDDYIE